MKTVIGSIGAAGCAVVLVIAVVFGAGALYIVYLDTLGVANINAQRQVTTHSQQYVQTQQKVILDYYADWTAAPDSAHKQAASLQLCATAALLDSAEYPAQAQPFIAQNCH